ncbi:translation initiation factor 2 [Streptomyces sp. NPDC090306]|uniref:translation initiation factor 2 n=1 Tax=Streptomyces sp. NPDC090306 TaxID=3365961 RepID=UPI0037F15829
MTETGRRTREADRPGAVGATTAPGGLALNPAAPATLLLRLLRPEHAGAWPALARRRAEFPPGVLAAVVAHPHRDVRAALARNPHVDPAARGLLVDDPDPLVRALLCGPPRGTYTAAATRSPARAHHPLPAGARPVRPLPDDVIDRVLTTYDDESVAELIVSGQIPYRVRRAYGSHPSPRVRRLAAGRWEHLSEDERAALLADPDAEVRESARTRLSQDDAEAVEARLGPFPLTASHATALALVEFRLSRRVVDHVLESGLPGAAWMLAHNRTTPPDVVAVLAGDPDPRVRREVARREDLAPGLVASLAHDPDVRVRTEISVRPGLGEDERAAIDHATDTGEDFGPFPHHEDPAPDPALSAAYARSRHPLLRRRAARDPALPAPLAALLARDDDLGVRVLLAHNHPAAPPELLLRAYLEHPGAHRGLLTENPRFPVAGLGARFAAADEPDVRLLATLDPGLAPAAADRLTRDTAPAVRAAAVRHPRLPAARLSALLDDGELRGAAAANPALPESAMYALLGGGEGPEDRREDGRAAS